MFHKSLNLALQKMQLKSFNEMQKTVFNSFHQGNISLQSSTGSGKTLAFLLPSIDFILSKKAENNPEILILTPSRELAKQILKICNQLLEFTDRKALSLTSGSDFTEQKAYLRKPNSIIVATPGKACQHLNAKTLITDNLKFIIFDEADAIINNLTKDINALLPFLHAKQKFIFASASNEKNFLVSNLVTKKLSLQTIHINVQNKPDIEHLVYVEIDKITALKNILQNFSFKKCVIFSNSSKPQITALFKTLNIKFNVVDSATNAVERHQAVHNFRFSSTNVLLSSTLLSRGIDVVDVDLVVNFDIPKINDYLHVAGRTGRAEQSGKAITIIKDNQRGEIFDISNKHKVTFSQLKFTKNKFKVELFKKTQANPKTKKVQKVAQSIKIDAKNKLSDSFILYRK